MGLDEMEGHQLSMSLVGSFLQEFAEVEELVTTVLARLLRLDRDQRTIFLDNMPAARKFKALLDMAPHLPNSLDREQLVRDMKTLLSANDRVRVKIAHRRFGPGTKDLVVFAPGGRHAEESAWSRTEFQVEIDKVGGTLTTLETLETVLVDKQLKDAAKIIGALLPLELAKGRSDTF